MSISQFLTAEDELVTSPTKTVLVNLFGGPGSGKSTLAAGVFYELKTCGHNAELVAEYAKEFAWEEKPINKFDQITIFAEQMKREVRLLNQVDFIITDSPVLLGPFYEQHYNNGKSIVEPLVRSYLQELKDLGIQSFNLMLPTPKHPYREEGRYQSEEEALKIHKAIEKFANSRCYLAKLETTNPEEVLKCLPL